jgi:hypothetical protein
MQHWRTKLIADRDNEIAGRLRLVDRARSGARHRRYMVSRYRQSTRRFEEVALKVYQQ